MGCDIFLMGDDNGTREYATKFGVGHIPQIEKNKYGTPLVSSIFETINSKSKSNIVLYTNADILLIGDLLGVARAAHKYRPYFLVVGSRHNAEVKKEIVFDRYWKKRLRENTKPKPEGKRSRDYFMFPRDTFPEVPPFALGRGRWDSWLVGQALLRKIPVIDASNAIRCVHQNHNFAHLPVDHKIKRGAWGVKGPENEENKALIPKGHPSNGKLRTTAKIASSKSGLVVHDEITRD